LNETPICTVRKDRSTGTPLLRYNTPVKVPNSSVLVLVLVLEIDIEIDIVPEIETAPLNA
jgi:hypothetical protein